jgi:hypothetical protein
MLLIMIEEQLNPLLQAYPFYENGLLSRSCLESADINIDPAPPSYEALEQVIDVAKSLYGVVIHISEAAKTSKVINIGPSLYDEIGKSVKKYKKCNLLN